MVTCRLTRQFVATVHENVGDWIGGSWCPPFGLLRSALGSGFLDTANDGASCEVQRPRKSGITIWRSKLTRKAARRDVRVYRAGFVYRRLMLEQLQSLSTIDGRDEARRPRPLPTDESQWGRAEIRVAMLGGRVEIDTRMDLRLM